MDFFLKLIIISSKASLYHKLLESKSNCPDLGVNKNLDLYNRFESTLLPSAWKDKLHMNVYLISSLRMAG